MTAPTMLWRVIYDGFRAQYLDGDGIWAEDQDSGITLNSGKGTLRRVLGYDFIWWLKRASPFISAYSNKRLASSKQAEQLVKEGKKNVTICEIDVYASNRRAEHYSSM
ncbi:hypothetical protein COCMIDRAFT_111089 [Bipolaris oryzae ATCC 44560]|uniref:Uncharacterized protein n=1 Tax=Bipolaris oryzae ATCC 44560 TaxID=930090 RepID=W6YPL9_COCMI|nr:uncharacterized protein COCMIDRAFT_111089 [Bipolaris oryzae ATCC 44560]EUC39605.1 hypothetical protein COCMIDRAFT_111089 [Bipolaris oryzae ATCC 44560]